MGAQKDFLLGNRPLGIKNIFIGDSNDKRNNKKCTGDRS
jgi:hypothetical protein